jgi:pheromone a factor receptor
MRHPELLAAASLASVLILIPLPAQVRVRNVALLVLIVGTFFINLISLVNMLVWAGNVRDVAPVWCDIGK